MLTILHQSNVNTTARHNILTHGSNHYQCFGWGNTCTIHTAILLSLDCRRSSLHKKVTIHQVTIMLATCKVTSNVLFPGPNHLLATGTNDPSLCWGSGNTPSVRSSAQVVSRCLAPGIFLELLCCEDKSTPHRGSHVLNILRLE